MILYIYAFWQWCANDREIECGNFNVLVVGVTWLELTISDSNFDYQNITIYLQAFLDLNGRTNTGAKLKW